MPYPAQTMRDLKNQLLFGEVPRPSALSEGVPDAMCDLIRAMLAKDPAARPRLDDRLLATLAGFAAQLRPTAEIVPRRYLMRDRHGLVVVAAQQVQAMQKVLTELSLKIQHVFSDIDGASAQAIISAILAGERDPAGSLLNSNSYWNAPRRAAAQRA